MIRVFGVILSVVGIGLIFCGGVGLYGHWFTDIDMTPTVYEVLFWIVAGVFGLLVGIHMFRNF